jgi:hypothetical protein
MEHMALRIGKETELTISFSEQDGTLRIDTQSHVYILSPSEGVELLQWLFEKYDILYRLIQSTL